MWQLLSSPKNEGSFDPLPRREVSGSGPAKEKKKAPIILAASRLGSQMLRLGVFV